MSKPVKNLSPIKLTFLISLSIQIPFAVFLAFSVINSLYLLLIIPVNFLVCYAIVYTYIVKVIEDKIKIIFKIINSVKSSKRESFFQNELLPLKTLNAVQADVEDWAIKKNNELQNLQETDKYRKELLQNLSHELKTPIFALQGFIGILQNENDLPPATKLKFWNNTQNNLNRLTTLVSDLDKITKLDTGEIPLEKSKFVMQQVIKEVFESATFSAAENNIILAIKPGCEFPLTVNADKEKIKQVLTNLVENAIKYGRLNGIVEASVYKTDGNFILTEITDNGIGIAKVHHARIFERFYRTDFARDRKIGGSGLGLAICKHIIEAHGTTMHIRSAEDVGTTFGFILGQ